MNGCCRGTLFDLRGELGRPALLEAAKGVGLDTARVASDLDTGIHDAKVEAGLASGERSGVTGTPAFSAGSARIDKASTRARSWTPCAGG